MLTIVEGNVAALREEMRIRRSNMQQAIRDMKKGKYSYREISAIENRLPLFDRYATPVRVENIIINKHVYDQFTKKLGRTVLNVSVDEHKLTVEYEVRGTKGVLTLYDISKVYEGFTTIPVAKVIRQDDVQS